MHGAWGKTQGRGRLVIVEPSKIPALEYLRLTRLLRRKATKCIIDLGQFLKLAFVNRFLEFYLTGSISAATLDRKAFAGMVDKHLAHDADCQCKQMAMVPRQRGGAGKAQIAFVHQRRSVERLLARTRAACESFEFGIHQVDQLTPGQPITFARGAKKICDSAEILHGVLSSCRYEEYARLMTRSIEANKAERPSSVPIGSTVERRCALPLCDDRFYLSSQKAAPRGAAFVQVNPSLLQREALTAPGCQSRC